MRIRKILLPTDGSKPARAAETMAVLLCNSMPECEIEVVTVIHPREHLYSRSVPFAVQSTEEDVKKAQALLSEVGERVRSQITNPRASVYEQLLEHSSPATAIIQEAEVTGESALIVIGNRGLGGFAGLALGSVSSQVLHGAKGPVLVAKEGQN